MQLYYHKTDGGAEYLTDTFIGWEHNGKSGKEGTFTDKTRYIVRIDGDITKDAELSIREAKPIEYTGLSVIANVNIEIPTSGKTKAEAELEAQNYELPKEYVENSYEFIKVIDPTNGFELLD